MDAPLFQRMVEVEDRHWWFRGRRRVVARALEALALPDGATILDLGCGTGGNLAMLARFGHLSACEADEGARGMAVARQVVPVEAGALPDQLSYPPSSFDLVVMTDVLEHVEQDRPALVSVARLLRPGGRLVLTVPALPWLWTARDEAHYHFRRYTRATLAAALHAGGFGIERLAYYNMLLFPAMVGQRMVARAGGRPYEDDLGLPPAWINRLLEEALAAEWPLVRRGLTPVGASLLAIAQAEK